MLFKLLSDIVVVIHFAFIFFVIFGGLLLLRWPSLIWWHLPAFIWGMLILVFQVTCPLTPLENWLLVLGGATPYDGGFITHHLLPIIYTPLSVLPFSIEVSLVLCTLFINVFVYGRRSLRWLRRLMMHLRASR